MTPCDGVTEQTSVADWTNACCGCVIVCGCVTACDDLWSVGDWATSFASDSSCGDGSDCVTLFLASVHSVTERVEVKFRLACRQTIFIHDMQTQQIE